MLEIEPALATFGAALALAGLAVLLALLSFVSIWRHGRPGLGRATGGLLLGLALLAYPAYLGYRASKLPALTDISTDTDNPPRFHRARPASARPGGLDYPGGKAADQQDEAYPDLAALHYVRLAPRVYRAALTVALKRKWQLIDAHPPGGVRREGVIELVARTPIMGFRDDVVIRVAPSEDGARIDVRSASRYGTHDFGANAARIRSLLEDIDDAAGEISPEPQPAAAPEKEKKPAKRPPRRAPRR